MSKEAEQLLLEFIVPSRDRCNTLDKQFVLQKAAQLERTEAKARGADPRWPDGKASEKWWRGFKKRHGIPLRSCQVQGLGPCFLNRFLSLMSQHLADSALIELRSVSRRKTFSAYQSPRTLSKDRRAHKMTGTMDKIKHAAESMKDKITGHGKHVSFSPLCCSLTCIRIAFRKVV